MKRILYIVCLILVASSAQSQLAPSRYFRPGLMTYWTKSDTSLSVNVDTANYGLRNYVKFWGRDSGATAASQKDVEQFAGTVNSLNGANDSVNVTLYGGVYHVHPNLWSQYLDRVSIATDLPGYVGPSTWRTDLPIITGDSCVIYRISRNAARPANARIWLTAYKVAKNTGLSFANTVGVFYDALIFNENQFKAVGAGNTQCHFQFAHKRVQ